jgi:hypothetical protein
LRSVRRCFRSYDGAPLFAVSLTIYCAGIAEFDQAEHLGAMPVTGSGSPLAAVNAELVYFILDREGESNGLTPI